MRVHFESLTKEPLHLYVVYDPSLSGNGDDDSGSTVGSSLVASDAKSGSALVSSPAFTETSSGYLGTSDGWTDLSSHDAMDWNYTSAPDGNVVQTGAHGADRQTRQPERDDRARLRRLRRRRRWRARTPRSAAVSTRSSTRTSPGGTTTSPGIRARGAWLATKSSTTSR